MCARRARSPFPFLCLLPLFLAAAALSLDRSAAGPVAPAVSSGIWSQIGPYGGTVKDLLFDPIHRGVVYATTWEHGVFKSVDDAASWNPMNRGFRSLYSIEKLTLSPAAPSVLYALTDDGLYRSVDGGRWEALPTGQGLGSLALAADPARAGVLWAHCFYPSYESAICRSPDGGQTWERRYKLASGSDVANFAFDPQRPSLVYVALQKEAGRRPGILRSRDGGATWQVIGRGLPLSQEDGLVKTAVAVAPDTGVVYASVLRYGMQATFRSADQGRTWALTGPGGYPIATGPAGSVVTGSGARSLDGGNTWTPGGGIDAVVLSVAIDPFDGRLALAGTERRGVFRVIADQIHWSLSNQGMTATHPLALVADPKAPGTLYASVWGGGLFKTTSGGKEWELIETGLRNADGLLDVAVLALDSLSGPTLYALQDTFELGTFFMRSSDGGRSWEMVSEYKDIPFYHYLAVDPHSPGTIYATEMLSNCMVSRSTDWGESWQCLREGRASQIVVDPSHPESLYAAGDRILSSHDGGSTWGPASLHLQTYEILCLEVAPSQSDVLYVGSSGRGVRQSTDRGRTWHSANGDLPAIWTNAYAIAIDPRNAKRVYALLEDAVYYTLDGGRHWKPLEKRPAVAFDKLLLVDPNDPRTLYAGTAGSGFFKIRVPE